MLTPFDPYLFAQAINRPHQPAFRVTVLDGLGVPLQTIEYLDGGVTATLSSQVTRNAEILIDPALSPADETGLLYPNGNRLYIERGIGFGCDTSDLLPVFHGRINAVFDTPDAPTRITAVDLAADVRDAGFTVPTNSVATSPILDEFQRLVTGALNSATFGPSDAFAPLVGARTYDTDRAQALDDLANSVAAFWYTLPDGRFVMRRVPWTVPAAPSLIIYDQLAADVCQLEGADPATSFLYATSSTRARTRDSVANVITVAAELVDGTPPYVYTAADTDPTSPTYIGGNFGVKSRHVRTDVAGSPAQARLMAESALARTKALTDGWSVQAVPDPRIELGDCVEVQCQRKASVQIVAALRMPLNPKGKMDISTRALLPALVQAS